jgi:hypothetical protein
MTKYDVAVIGAGLAGLVCAQKLQDNQLQVIVLDKSRGVGGRVATRRLHDTRVDHGLPLWENQGKFSEKLLQKLQQEGLLKQWIDEVYEWTETGLKSTLRQGYVPAAGMNAIAKYLAQNLNICKQCRVTNIQAQTTWQLHHTASDEPMLADLLVLAIPAPQAYDLLNPLPLPSTWLSKLAGVTYNPCLALMAGYSPAHLLNFPWKALRLHHPELAWVALDSSKRPPAPQPVFLLQSTPDFAQQFLDATELEHAGQHLLTIAAEILLPWLKSPDWFQIHRWRYATPHDSLAAPYLASETLLPLVCCGDWCGGEGYESALASGEATALQIQHWLK